tara:strand:- start:349 stop:1200 length:852 start_codon:yes stop_codon:yes gene_type:complete
MAINLEGEIMKWFDIIKVEDIDFDNAIEAFGMYMGESKKLELDEVFNILFSGKNLTFKDAMHESIRINPALSYDYLKDKLEREPTDKDISDFIIRIIMHEGTHAGMAEEQFSMTSAQEEYGAFVGQFPESTYLRLKTFLMHPQARTSYFPPSLTNILGVKGMHTPRTTEMVETIIAFVDGITRGLSDDKLTGEIKEKLARLEITARQAGKPEISEINFNDIEEMKNRYGAKEFDALYDMIQEALEKVKGSDLEKITGAVSTSSAPALFNVKYSGKKEDEEDAR